MADQLTPIFAFPYPDPNDPLGGIEATVEALALAVETEVSKHLFPRRLIRDVDSNTTTTTEGVGHSFSWSGNRAGDLWDLHCSGLIHSTVSGDIIMVRLRADSSSGTILNEIAVQTYSTTETNATPFYIAGLFTAAAAGFRTCVLTIQRVAGSGTVKLQASATQPFQAYLYRALRVAP